MTKYAPPPASPASHRDEKFRALAAMGAGDFAHINGSLEEHFTGVHDMLVEWGARPVLCDAGLFHAAYGTAHFADAMLTLDKRALVADIIGAEAEAIVYRYCSCDRATVWPRIGTAAPLPFDDRFTGETILMPLEELKEFCELTAANELQIAAGDPGFREQHREGFTSLFSRMRPWLSEPGNRFARSLFDIGQ
ncbi:DUF6817 domain-containing protein [Emcibacter sp. SYSU 3D8]|uniref:DUF6817 domain-containing protein n=1 Tax=Emcibacter sp. SYSU 3D8 TaxID=3133969 RepID=UPI0031FF33E4